MSSKSYISEYFSEQHLKNKEIRNKSYKDRIDFLNKSDIEFEEKSNGHCRIFINDGKFDVWLTTGKWTKVGTNKYNQGWKQFLSMIDKLKEIQAGD